jgi:hypothetical protein
MFLVQTKVNMNFKGECALTELIRDVAVGEIDKRVHWCEPADL